VALIIAWRLFVGPKTEEFKTIPSYLKTTIPLYDSDSIEHIIVVPKKYKERSYEISNLFKNPFSSNIAQKFSNLFSASISTNTTFQIQWGNIEASPNFIASYYKKELRKKNYTIEQEAQTTTTQQFFFRRSDGLNGFFMVTGKDVNSKSTHAFLEAHIPEIIIDQLPTTSPTNDSPSLQLHEDIKNPQNSL
jgi:hypothetical protein